MELKVLHQHGWSVSQLAREFGLNWRTVKRAVTQDTPHRYPQRPKPTTLTEAQAAHVERRLAVCPTIRGTDLYRELCRDYQYTASYPSFARRLLRLRPPALHEPEIRFETAPGVQLQTDWAHFGTLPLGEDAAELWGLVSILGYSRAPAIHFARDHTRQTTFACLVQGLADLGGLPREVLTDRDPAFCIGATSDGQAILAPEWVDLCDVLGVVPKACRPYRAKTKGKVERMVRELKESFLPWLSGQVLPHAPDLGGYDALGRQWIREVILPRCHRTTQRIVGDAWAEERSLLRPLPTRLLHAPTPPAPARPTSMRALPQWRLGEHGLPPDLTAYEVVR